MFTANDCEGLIREAQDVGISKVIAKSGDGVVNHLQAAIKDVFHERDGRVKRSRPGLATAADED